MNIARQASVAARPGFRDGSFFRASLLLMFLGLALVTFWPTARFLVTDVWGHVDYSHGPVVAVVAILLIARAAARVTLADRVSRSAVALLVACLGTGIVARFAYVDLVQQFAIVACTWLAGAVAFGWRGAVALAFPVGFLLFATQAWDAATYVLQPLTVSAVEFALRVAAIPVVVDGTYLTVPAGTFDVERGCSGQRFFVAALAGGCLYAYLHRLTPRRAALSVGLAAGLALVTNWVRVFVIIWRGQATDMQSTLIVDGHYALGWIIFAAAAVVFLLVMTPLTPVTSEPVLTNPRAAPDSGSWRPPTVALAVLAIAGGYGTVRFAGLDEAPIELRLPSAVGGWSGPESASMQWQAGFNRPDSERYAAYTSAAGTVDVYVAEYRTQEPGRKLVGFGSSIGAAGWRVRPAPLPAGPRAAANGAVVTRPLDGRRWYVRYWYRVGDRRTAEPQTVRRMLAWQAFSPRRPAGVFAVAAPCTATCEEAEQVVDTFIEAAATTRGGLGLDTGTTDARKTQNVTRGTAAIEAQPGRVHGGLSSVGAI